MLRNTISETQQLAIQLCEIELYSTKKVVAFFSCRIYPLLLVFHWASCSLELNLFTLFCQLTHPFGSKGIPWLPLLHGILSSDVLQNTFFCHICTFFSFGWFSQCLVSTISYDMNKVWFHKTYLFVFILVPLLVF